ncbi:MAG: methyltransferase domain-containing protein, partial [Vicinamibacteria bacterium]|nr:methyltransferase domain-containing protein [Vicinamibacteria bacterium]
FETGSFDRVISCLVVDHVLDLGAFFGELRRVCRDDGFIVISVMHPAMMLKGVQARFTDPRSGQEVRPQSVANRISDYVMGVVSAGLRVIEASEHDAGPDLVARAPRARKYLGWPMLFLMKLAR